MAGEFFSSLNTASSLGEARALPALVPITQHTVQCGHSGEGSCPASAGVNLILPLKGGFRHQQKIFRIEHGNNTAS